MNELQDDDRIVANLTYVRLDDAKPESALSHNVNVCTCVSSAYDQLANYCM